MCGAPQRWFARLIAPMRLRSSAEILRLPTGLRDRSRQYDWNPARCQRMIVSGRRIAIARRTEGNQRQSQTNRKRSVLLSCGRFDTCRRSTLSCWRRIRISATSFVLGLKSEAMIWRISRSNSIIKWQGYRVSASRLAESNFRYTQGAVALLIDFRFYELRQVSQRLLPAEVTRLLRDDIRQAFLDDV